MKKKSYSRCPNPKCGNEDTESGYANKRCKSCGAKGCSRTALAGFGWSEGCYISSCPKCGEEPYTIVGYLKG